MGDDPGDRFRDLLPLAIVEAVGNGQGFGEGGVHRQAAAVAASRSAPQAHPCAVALTPGSELAVKFGLALPGQFDQGGRHLCAHLSVCSSSTVEVGTIQ